MLRSVGSVDVLVVGAGPVGLALAAECLRHGATVRLIDRLGQPSEKSKALAIWASAMEALHGMGCAEAFLKNSFAGEKLVITAEGKAIGSVDLGLEVDSPFHGARLLPQAETERILTSHLRFLGGSVERGVELISFEEGAEGVKSRLRLTDGREEVVQSRWLVGCDGAHSLVRHRLGFEFEGSALEENFILADVRIDPEPEPNQVVVDWGGDGVLALFPVTEGTWRVVANRKNPELSGDPTLGEINEQFALHGREEWRASDPTWLSNFRISERKASGFYKGRVMIAGDAAHIHSPAGGQGMNTGIQDAFNLGWKLGLLARGHGEAERLLASYEAERAPVAAKVVEEAEMRTKVALLKNPVLRALRNFGVSTVARTRQAQEAMALNLSGLDIVYEESPILDTDSSWPEEVRDAGFPPGSRPRDVTVFAEDGAEISLFYRITGGPHTLVLFSGQHPRGRDARRIREYAAKAEKLAGRDVRVISIWCGSELPDEGVWLVDPDGNAHEHFALQDLGAYMIRPDGYVAFRCSPFDEALLEDYAAVMFAATSG